MNNITAKYYVWENGERIAEFKDFAEAFEYMKKCAMQALSRVNEKDEFECYEYGVMEVFNGSSGILNRIIVNHERA